MRRSAGIALLAGALLAGSAQPTGSATTSSEYLLKAAFLYQFTKYVTWPEQSRGRMAICVLGEDPFGPALDETLADKTAKGQPIVARRIGAAARARSCHVLFLSRSEGPRLAATLAELGDRPILTVADMADFPSRGGMINLKLVKDRVKLEINPDNAERVGLKIRSELLRLAEVVRN